MAAPHSTAEILLVAGALVGMAALLTRASGRVGLPVALGFVLVGLVAGSEARGGIAFEDYQLTLRVGTTALALILFDGGMHTPLSAFRSALRPAAVLATAGYLFLRRRDWRRLAQLGAAVAGAAALYEIVKPIVGRPRPPVAIQIVAEEGWAFPSGHVTQAVAFYGILAVMLMARPSLRLRVLLGIGAVLVAFVVGASRLYLGVHWLTDVLGGYALGTAWLSVVMVVTRLTSSGWATWNGAAAARPSKDSLEGAAERGAA
jgi:membrane-associated phospholipid phosphatase